jgi:putative ABC transport system permease protein
MFRHLLKLTWKRKTRNLMLSLEILLAFAIVFAVAAFGVRYWQLYQLPIGFDARDVWAVSLIPADRKAGIDAAAYDALRRGLRELPEVAQVAVGSFEPYAMSSNAGSWKNPGGASVRTGMLDADDNFAAVLGLHLVEGRWFSPLDDGAPAIPVVLNRRMAEAMFPGKPALGQQFDDTDREAKVFYKVVGVVDEYREGGELMTPENFTFVRFVSDPSSPGTNPRGADTLLLKLRPGTTRSFESKLSRQLKLIRNDWSFQIAPVSDTRKSTMKVQVTPLLILGVIGAFMLVMVAFGLFGTLWQNTTQRIPEIGLRRAIGARSSDIYGQIVAEQLLLSSVAIVLGLGLLVQLPLTGALGESLNWTVFIAAAGLSMFVIYLLSLLCSLYPGWRASRLSPTEALHYE